MRTRARILDAAEALFAEKGIDAVSTREIIRRADVNASSVTYYFVSRDGLLRALADRAYETYMKALAATVRRASQTDPPPTLATSLTVGPTMELHATPRGRRTLGFISRLSAHPQYQDYFLDHFRSDAVVAMLAPQIPDDRRLRIVLWCFFSRLIPNGIYLEGDTFGLAGRGRGGPGHVPAVLADEVTAFVLASFEELWQELPAGEQITLPDSLEPFGARGAEPDETSDDAAPGTPPQADEPPRSHRPPEDRAADVQRRAPEGDTRRLILDTARALFAERSIDGTATRDIFEASGVNQGSIHYYWKTKARLVEEIIDETAPVVPAAIDRHLALADRGEPDAAGLAAAIVKGCEDVLASQDGPEVIRFVRNARTHPQYAERVRARESLDELYGRARRAMPSLDQTSRRRRCDMAVRLAEWALLERRILLQHALRYASASPSRQQLGEELTRFITAGLGAQG